MNFKQRPTYVFIQGVGKVVIKVLESLLQIIGGL